MKKLFLGILVLIFIIYGVSGIDTDPPASIEGLYYTTPNCYNITWHWTLPADQDLNHTMIYRNGVFFYNLSALYDDDTWEGLDYSTAYIISILTVDATGNVNTTWVNETAITATCEDPETLTADFTSNTTCHIGKPVTVQFNGTCDEATIKNHWDFGDGNTSDDVQNPVNTYSEYGTYNVSHSCKDGTDPTIFVNKTDYIIVGVTGTVCSGDCFYDTDTYEPDWFLDWLF